MFYHYSQRALHFNIQVVYNNQLRSPTISTAASSPSSTASSPRLIAPRGTKRRPNSDETSKRHKMRRVRHSTDEPTKAAGRQLACPYYRLDPIRHRDCLLHKLGSTSFTVQHLRRNHSQPIHYVKYGQIFEKPHERDEHYYYSVNCEPRDFVFEGVSELQFQELHNTPRNLNESDRWFRIWAILFPGMPCHVSPYILSREDEFLTLVAHAIQIRFGPTGGNLVSDILEFLTWENLSTTVNKARGILGGNAFAAHQLQTPLPLPSLPLSPESMASEWSSRSSNSNIAMSREPSSNQTLTNHHHFGTTTTTTTTLVDDYLQNQKLPLPVPPPLANSHYELSRTGINCGGGSLVHDLDLDLDSDQLDHLGQLDRGDLAYSAEQIQDLFSAAGASCPLCGRAECGNLGCLTVFLSA